MTNTHTEYDIDFSFILLLFCIYKKITLRHLLFSYSACNCSDLCVEMLTSFQTKYM